MTSGTPTPAVDFAPLTSARLGRVSVRTVACAAVAAAFVSVAGLPALAEPVTANVVVADSIALRNLTGSFTITGAPGTTQTAAAPVSMNVLTNDPDGYSLTMQATTDVLSPLGDSPDTIPIELLEVAGGDLGGYVPVPGTSDDPLTFAGETDRSAAAGDDISTTFRMAIPNVDSDTYRATLNVIASAL